MSNKLYDSKTFSNLMHESAVFLQCGRKEQAILSIKKALDLKLDVFILGIPGLKAAIKERMAAFSEWGKIIAKNDLPPNGQMDFADAVHFITFDKSDEHIEKAVLLCLRNPLIDPQNLVSVGLNLFFKKPYPSLSDPLLLALMEQVVLPDGNLEKLLTEKRKELLLNIHDKDFLEGHRSFIYALSLQCCINEYVYTFTDTEKALVQQLWNLISSKGSFLDSETKLLIALYSCYYPLYTTPLRETLLALSSQRLGENWVQACDLQFEVLSSNIQRGAQITNHKPGPNFLPASQEDDPHFFSLLNMQVFNPHAEKELSSTIPMLNLVEDPISQKVRLQYEENPYPCWNRLDCLGPVPMQQILSEIFPHLKELAILWPEHPRILVAGCGTGQLALNFALRYLDCEVTALDFSLPSLAYAKRRAKEIGVTNIRFVQGDILGLDIMQDKFDVISSSGVLHHMQDPVAGWRILSHLLAANGWMHIGLYSKISRRFIAEARQYINQKGYKGTSEDIRKCRQDILHLPDGDPIKSVVRLHDFYTMSTCRDLLFHVHELQFTLPQIEGILKELQLEFVGFDLPLASSKSFYKKMFPDDPAMVSLQNWHRFEQAYPDTFLTMYQFWVLHIEADIS